MNKFILKLLLIFGVFVISLLARFLTLNQMGRTWDEHSLVEKAYIDLQLAKQGDFSDIYWYKYSDHPPLANYFYSLGAVADLQKYIPTPVPPYGKGTPIFHYDLTYSRSISVFFSSLTVLLIILIGWRYISFFVGISGGVILALLPYFLGLSQLVTYESVIALFFTAGVFLTIEFLVSKRIRFLMLSGVFGGLLLDIKQSNVLFFGLVVLLYVVFFWKKQKSLQLKTVLLHSVIFTLSAFVGCFIFWPMPWFHLSEYLSYTHSAWFSFSSSNIELFFGKVHHVPIIYYVVNLLVTIPIGVLFLLFVGIRSTFKARSKLLLGIFIWFAFPFIQSLYPLRQSGLRYIIEIYPPLCLLAAIGLEQVKNFKKKVIVSAVLLIYLLFTLNRISPYYLDYFNELIGGTGIVYKYHLFDLGWWGEGEKQAVQYIKAHAPKGSTIGLALDPVHTVETFPDWNFVSYDKNKSYNFIIVNYFATIRGGIEETQISKEYKLVYTVYAGKAELVHVYKKNEKR